MYACEGALLVVDAAQGVEAQSVANCYTAIEQGLEVVPVLNKMDLPQAEPERVKEEIENIIGIDATDAIHCSAKSGMGIDELLEQLLVKIPAPIVDRTLPSQDGGRVHVGGALLITSDFGLSAVWCHPGERPELLKFYSQWSA